MSCLRFVFVAGGWLFVSLAVLVFLAAGTSVALVVAACGLVSVAAGVRLRRADG